MSLIDATDKVPAFTLAGTIRPAKVVSCYDGDTFAAVMTIGTCEQLWKFDCRMLGYDAPEMKPLKTIANREEIKVAALRSKIALASFLCDGIDTSKSYTSKEIDAVVKLNKRIIELRCKEFDKYGRVLVEVPNTAADSTVNSWMIENKYGYPYSGGTKKVFESATA